MIFTTNAFRRAAAGAALVLSALAVPATTAHAATPTASVAASATATASAVYGPYWDLRYCVPQMEAYPGSYCFLRNGRWYLYIP